MANAYNVEPKRPPCDPKILTTSPVSELSSFPSSEGPVNRPNMNEGPSVLGIIVPVQCHLASVGVVIEPLTQPPFARIRVPCISTLAHCTYDYCMRRHGYAPVRWYIR